MSLPGERSRSALLAIADVSAFLPAPDADLASAPIPDAAGQKTILSRAVDFVLATTAKMPDFLAQKRTSRFQDMKSATYENEPVVSTPDLFHLIDDEVVTVRYRDGHEEDSDSSNTHKQKKAVQSERGLTTQGIFGPMLQTVMHDILNGKIGWSHWEQSPSGPLAVFRYSVPREHATFTVTWCCVDAGPGIFRKLQIVPKYHGEISVDPESGAITRLVLMADLDPDQPVSTVDLFVEYGPVEIGGRTYVCPTRTGTLLIAKSFVEHGRQVRSGETYLHATEEKLNITSVSDSHFDQYHVFRSEMKIVD